MSHPALDDPAVRQWRDQNIYRLLLRANRSTMTSTLEKMRALGHPDVSLADTNLLANLDTEGTIISALARRAGITRQAASQQIVSLERAGYVKRFTSADDGRAAIIRQTARGRELLDDALDVVEELERVYAKFVGSTQLKNLKELLTLLLEHIDPGGTLGLD